MVLQRGLSSERRQELAEMDLRQEGRGEDEDMGRGCAQGVSGRHVLTLRREISITISEGVMSDADRKD